MDIDLLELTRAIDRLEKKLPGDTLEVIASSLESIAESLNTLVERMPQKRKPRLRAVKNG